jgi:hypothetical protein
MPETTFCRHPFPKHPEAKSIRGYSRVRMPYNEHHALQFRTEFFNAFNKLQFANPDWSLADAAFGQVTSTKLDNREIQLTLKYQL